MTHALAGMLVAEAVCTWRRESRPELRAAAYLVSALANNLPDIDIVYTWITGPKPLGSLLHHRGHTHTLLLALPGAWLLYRVVLAVLARLGQQFEPRERRLLLGLSLGGGLLHLSLDFGNSYGVHPFWPVSARWFYGDTIFIVEPLWWAVAMPIVAAAARRLWLKLTLWVLLVGILIVAWFFPLVHPASRSALLAITAGSWALGRWGSPPLRAYAAVAGVLLVALTFRLGSAAAKERLTRATPSAFPALEVHDIAVNPLPANPACWEALLVGEQGGRYRIVRANVALPPLVASSCAAGADVEPTARFERLQKPDREGVHYLSQHSAELSTLQALRLEDCRFRALLQFTRFPYAQHRSTEANGSQRLYAGDSRYDRNPGLDFADMELPLDPRRGDCPRFLPGWAEPRGDLLQR